jgi:very-short-patch-repair endonuclease
LNLVEALGRKALLKERARYMRANPTDAERRLWSILRNKRLAGLRWKRQQVIDDLYIVDFICFEHRLIVEADGSQHADNRADERRDAYLKSQGFQVMRFWNSDVLARTGNVGETIFAAVESFAAQTRGAPSPSHALRFAQGAGPFLPRKGGGEFESETNVQL